MRRLSFLSGICASALLLIPGAVLIPDARAQDQEQQTVLPDLAPREVEIRGQLQISFPSLRRQPLVGFNPPPRVPEIPLDRKPFLESYADAGASIVGTPLQKPEPPGVAALSGAPPFWAEAEIGAGRYFTRLIRGTAVRQMGPGRQLDVALRYEGSDGHSIPGVEDEVKNVNDDFAGAISYSVLSDGLALSAGVSGYVSSYSLFGIDNSSGGSVQPNPNRDGRHGSMHVSLGSGSSRNTSFRVGATVESTRYTSDLFSSRAIVDPSTERTEKRVTLTAGISVPMQAMTGYADGKAAWAGLDAGGLAGSDNSYADVGAGIRRSSDRYLVKAGARLLNIGYAADAGGVTGEDRSATYVSPDLDLSYRYGDVLTIVGTNRPFVRANSLTDLFSENPYLVNEPAMQPSILSVNAEAGLVFSSGAVQFRPSVQLRRSPNWGFFAASTGSGASSVVAGFFDVGYGEGRVTSVGGQMATSRPAGLQLSGSVYVHDTELTNVGVQIPYHPRLSGQMGLSFPFGSRRGLVQANGRFIGERYVDVSETESAEPYLDIDVYARYDVRPNLGLVLRVRNMGVNEHEIWASYPQSPFVVMGGVRLLW